MVLQLAMLYVCLLFFIAMLVVGGVSLFMAVGW